MTWQAVFSEPNALGESPFWHPTEQALYFTDIAARQVLRAHGWANPPGAAGQASARVPGGTNPANTYATDTAQLDCWDLPQDPGCIAPARSGGLVLALRDGIYRARTWRGVLVKIASFDYDAATTRFNDGKCDALGRLWAGTLYEPKDAQKAVLFSVDARGGKGVRVQRQAGNGVTANGLAWSPDGATLYWADTAAHTIRAWDFDVQDNALSNERMFQQFAAKPAGWLPGMAGYGGRPDGAAVDVQGNYYVAMFEGARIAKFAASGQWLADLAVPVRCPTMPCFGGPDLKTLFVTSASHNRPPHELEAYPQSGCVFSMQVDVPGLPVNFFDDTPG